MRNENDQYAQLNNDIKRGLKMKILKGTGKMKQTKFNDLQLQNNAEMGERRHTQNPGNKNQLEKSEG